MADSRYEVAATALKQIVDATFAAEDYKATHDHLHESLGHQRVVIGISPLRIIPMPTNTVVDQTFIKIQFYGVYKRDIEPTQQVNPFKIAGYHDRLATAIEESQATDPASNEVWFFNLVSTEFPHDPTGNKTRFEMTIKAMGDSPGLETRA